MFYQPKQVWSTLPAHARKTKPVEPKSPLTKHSFRYLESIISSNGFLNKEIDSSIIKTSQALGWLYARVFTTSISELRSRMRILITTGNSSHICSLLHPLHFWQDHVSNLEFLDHIELTSIKSYIRAQMRYMGQIIGMNDCYMSHQWK